MRTRVVPLSTTSPFPELPLPREVNLSMALRGVEGQLAVPSNARPADEQFDAVLYFSWS
jgi:hypothetical protein